MCPMGDKPDCFNCPLPDCMADTHDLSRQARVEREESNSERDQIIVRDYLKGADINGLADRFGFKDPSNIRRILKQHNVDFRKIEKERRICWR